MWGRVDFRFLFAIYESIPLWFCGVRVSQVAEGRWAFEIECFMDQVAGEQKLLNEKNSGTRGSARPLLPPTWPGVRVVHLPISQSRKMDLGDRRQRLSALCGRNRQIDQQPVVVGSGDFDDL